jgi:spermidine synthase
MRWLYLSIDYLGLKLPTFNLESLHSLKESSKVLAKIDRIQTPYQAVDLVDTRGISNIVANSEGDFSVYLDRQPQFSISSERLYHESMVEGALHLAKNTPQKVVIFGGGDGLIARELLRHEEIKSIVLIELDSEILKISRENSVLSYLNEHSLDHPKVKLHVGDAFSFARKSEERFDAVFVDFPYPNNYELGRLYSLEFYQALKRILTPHGFAVLDAPLWRYIDKEISKNEVYPYQVIAKTLLTAGFAQPFFFGPVEPFVFLSNDGRSVAFDYQNLPHRISNRSFLNLSPIAHMRNENFLRSDIRVNSVLNPVPLWRLQ